MPNQFDIDTAFHRGLERRFQAAVEKAKKLGISKEGDTFTTDWERPRLELNDRDGHQVFVIHRKGIVFFYCWLDFFEEWNPK